MRNKNQKDGIYLSKNPLGPANLGFVSEFKPRRLAIDADVTTSIGDAVACVDLDDGTRILINNGNLSALAQRNKDAIKDFGKDGWGINPKLYIMGTKKGLFALTKAEAEEILAKLETVEA